MSKKIIVSLIIFLLISGGFFIFSKKSDILSKNPFLASVAGLLSFGQGEKKSFSLSEEEFFSLKQKIAFLEEGLEAREEELENLDDLIEKFDVLSQKISELETTVQNLNQIAIESEEEKMEGKLEKPEESEELEEEEGREEKEEGVCSVNINTASKEELQKITKVGPVLAQRIIEARPFYSLPDLIRVSGIGETTLQKIIEQGCAYVDESYSKYTGSAGGGGAPPPPASYPKILISEIQIEGLEDEKEEFVELYNPNATDVDLTGWYLQRKTKTATVYSSFATSALFSGEQIKTKEHFLVARESSSFTDLADITTDNPLTKDNVLVFKNPNGEITDKIGWGQAQDFEGVPTENPEPGKSLARIWNLETQEYQDIDNNSLDFKIQVPTPKEINQIPEPEPEPSASNLLLNEFFDDGWEGTAAAGNPVNWTWGKRGGLDFEDPPLVTGKKSFYHEPYSSFYDLTQLGKTLEVDKTYYAEIWVKGTGRVKLGIDYSDTTEWLAVAYTDFDNSPWTKMAFLIMVNANTNNGGIRIRMTRLAATDERLVIGAAWFSTNPPPENWLFQ